MDIAKQRESYVPKERGCLPRVLLLDFPDKTCDSLSNKTKFQIFRGQTGFVNGERYFPRDASELDIVFVDTHGWSKEFCESKNGITARAGDKLILADKLLSYFTEQILKKGGFVGIFLDYRPPKFLGGFSNRFSNVQADNEYPFIEAIKDNLMGWETLKNTGMDLQIRKRYSEVISLAPNVEDDCFYLFFQRYIKDEDIKFSVRLRHSTCSLVTNDEELVTNYFIDEDKNAYAAIFLKRILISPLPYDIESAITFLLQDVLPYVCGEQIYPDLHGFKWLNDQFFTPREILEKSATLADIKAKHAREEAALGLQIKELQKKYSYLQHLLYADSSQLFNAGEKLTDAVKRVLSDDLGFTNVRDMDKELGDKGQALKEDLVIDDNVFIEIKGTEGGASQKWLDQLNSNVLQYCSAHKIIPNAIKKIIIFNHERRKNPNGERSEPYANDSRFVNACQQDGVALIPVFELFKLVKLILERKISANEAQDKILHCSGVLKVTMK